MGDFEQQAGVDALGGNRFRATLHREWQTWGPNGGYLSAIALRAAGARSGLDQPVSYACQYLAVPRFEDVELEVTTLRAGKRSEALRVEMRQDDALVLCAQVWCARGGDGLEHDFVPAPDVPRPETLTPSDERRPPRGVYRNLDERVIDWVPQEEREPGEAALRAWYRFRPRTCGRDAISDATRPLVLLDTFSWPSIYGAHPKDGIDWIAPNFDFYARFHRDTRAHEWLLCESRSDLAEGGLIATNGSIWGEDGRLVASGFSTLFCRPRPPQFR